MIFLCRVSFRCSAKCVVSFLFSQMAVDSQHPFVDESRVQVHTGLDGVLVEKVGL